MIEIREAPTLSPAEVAELSDLLIAVVDDGASIGFLPPLDREAATDYWRGVLAPGVVLLLAVDEDRIVGTAQLHLSLRPNGSHRAEVAKVMVHPTARRRGIARQLMDRLDAVARRESRTLLVLDTRAGDPSNQLYRQLGYVERGRIPRYVCSADGQLHATVIYSKELTR